MFELNLMVADDELGGEGCPLDVAQLRAQCMIALEQQSRTTLADVDQIEISVQTLDVQAMQALNYQFRGKNSATNVLSFESELPRLPIENAGTMLALGDLVFCPEVIRQEAMQQGKHLAEHWCHLVVHGTLHLCGYDHTAAEEADDMENLEIRILSFSGIPNPYQIQSVQ